MGKVIWSFSAKFFYFHIVLVLVYLWCFGKYWLISLAIGYTWENLFSCCFGEYLSNFIWYWFRWSASLQINEFVKLGGDQLVPYYADILGAILPCISDKEEKIRVVSWLVLSLSCISLSSFLLFIAFHQNLSSVQVSNPCKPHPLTQTKRVKREKYFGAVIVSQTLFWYFFLSASLINQVARETNEELRAIQADPAEGFDVGAILSIARRCYSCNLEK